MDDYHSTAPTPNWWCCGGCFMMIAADALVVGVIYGVIKLVEALIN